MRHPNAAPLLLEHFPRHILRESYDYWAGRYPYPPELHLAILEGTEKLTYGSALFAAASLSQKTPLMPEYNPDQHPHLAQAVRMNPYTTEELFKKSISAFIEGFAAHRLSYEPAQPAAAPRSAGGR